MSAIEQAEELRTKAINLLLAERETLDAALTQMGYTAGTSTSGTVRKCKTCGEAGHTARFHKKNGPAVAEP